MNKTWLIFQREFLSRVRKKSFLIATIVVPMIFPAIIAIMGYILYKQEKGAVKAKVEVLDESGKMKLNSTDRYEFIPVTGEREQVKTAFRNSKHFGLLIIPEFELSKPEGMVLYTNENPSIGKVDDLRRILETSVHDLKLREFNIDKEILEKLKTSISLNNISYDKDSGEEQKSNTKLLSGLAFGLGILIYIFVLVYGMQIMLGVIEEKTSKVVEVLVSSVRPFQLMLGKILGIAAVGLLQFFIWVVLITVLSFATLSFFGVDMPQKQAMEQISKKMDNPEALQLTQQSEMTKALENLSGIRFAYIIFNFAFFFLGGYLLYGALFAAVGSAVDSQQEAQQFNLPLMLPLIIGYLSLFMFIIPDPHSTASFWFSIIPFTSPVAMVGRLPFGVPWWELVLSQVLLIGGFIFTTWIAARIYRVGILMHGSKINYKVLAKWFMMKS